MKYGLSLDQLKEITKVLALYPEVESAVLFGSRAIDTFKEASDIDMAIKGKKADYSLALKLKDHFEDETDLPFFFDVISYSTIKSEDLKKHIHSKGKVIYRKGWREVKLGDIIDVKHGYAFKGKHITDKPNKNILVTPGNFHITGGFKASKLKYYSGDIPQNYILEENNIIVTMTDLSKAGDTLGYSAKVPKSTTKEIYLHNQRIGLVQVNRKNISKDFVYWLMRTSSYRNFVVGAASGTSVRHTSPTTIKEYRFNLPSYKEQQKIAAILSTWDKTIDVLDRLIDQNEKWQKWLSYYLLRYPLDSWPMVELGEVCSFEYGKPLKKENRKSGEYPVFGSNGVVDYHNEYLVKGPLIIIGRKGSAGIVTYSEKSGFPIDTTFYIKLKKPTNLKCIYFILKSLNLKNINQQAGVPGLNRNDAYKVHIPFPPLDIQRDIVTKLSIHQDKILLLKNMKMKYVEQKKGLMQQLLTGKIRVKI